jgi:hypothetical protein
VTDIEKLIERLFADLVIDKPGYDALTRLVAPLPSEVEDAEYGLRIYCGDVQCDCVYMRTARLLESLAQKNARLAAENAEHIMYRAALATEAKELGDENDRLRAELDAVDQALLEEENYYANVGGDPAALRSARDTLGALARVRAKLAAKKGDAT